MNARVTILHDAQPPDAQQHDAEIVVAHAFDADVTEVNQPLMELTARESVPNGAALRIDMADAIWLGEAEHCAAGGDGFAIRIRLRHVLRDFETLARLAERFGSVSLPPAPESKDTSEQSRPETAVRG